MNLFENYYIVQQNKLSKSSMTVEQHFKSLLENYNEEEKVIHLICYDSNNFLTIPARGNQCKHIEAYQLINLIKLIKENLGSFQCFCGNFISLKDIYIDEYLKLLINTYPEFDREKNYLVISKRTGKYEIRKEKTNNKEFIENISPCFDLVLLMDTDDENFTVKCQIDFSNSSKKIPISICDISDYIFKNKKVSDKYLVIYSSLKNYLDNHVVFTGLILRDVFTLVTYIKNISSFSVYIIDVKYFITGNDFFFLELFLSFIIKTNRFSKQKFQIIFINNESNQKLIDNSRLENLIQNLKKRSKSSKNIPFIFINEKEPIDIDNLINESDFNNIEIDDYNKYYEELLNCSYNKENFYHDSNLIKNNLFEISLKRIEKDSIIIIDKNINNIGKELFFEFVNDTLFYINIGRYLYTNLLVKSNIFNIPNGYIMACAKDNIHSYLYCIPQKEISFKQILSERFVSNSVIVTNVPKIINSHVHLELDMIQFSELKDLDTKGKYNNSSIVSLDNTTIPENLDPNVYDGATIKIMRELKDNLYYFIDSSQPLEGNEKEPTIKGSFLFIERNYTHEERDKLRSILDKILKRFKKQNPFHLIQLIKPNYLVKNRISYQKISLDNN